MYDDHDVSPHTRRLPPCPEGHPQRPCQILGFRERNPCELELRVVLGHGDYGVCQLEAVERDGEVHVRAVVSYNEDERAEGPRYPETDCPVRTRLAHPLGDRAVINSDTDRELPLFIPAYLNNVPQADHGYHPVDRRAKRRTAG